MSKEIAAALSAPFEEKDLKHRPGRAGLVFTYADARAVAQRLDDVLGLTGWQFEVKVADAARCVVQGTLIIVVDGKTTLRSDFGYPNSVQDDEPLKSAASDALRRCAAQLGVGRSLYSPDKGAGATKPHYAAAPALSVPQNTPVGHSSEGVPTLSADEQIAVSAAMLFANTAGDGACSHGQAWNLKPGGVSKATNKPYLPFWAASHKAPDGSWCKDKPSRQWVAAHSDAPKPERLVPEDDLESLPF